MPVLPLSLPVPIDGDLPVNDLSDVTKNLPSSIQVKEPTVVLDSLLTALEQMALEYQSASSYAAGQSDPIRATQEYLEGLALDRGTNKQIGESDFSLEDRMFTPPDSVTPTAVLNAANNVLEHVTTVHAKYMESVQDRLYIFNGTQDGFLHSFIGPVNPQYFDRFYVDDATTNPGVRTNYPYYIPDREPGGAWCFSDCYGRFFVLRIPVLTSVNDIHDFYFNSFVDPSTVPSVNQAGTGNGIGSFVANGSNTGGSEADGTDATFVYSDTSTDLVTYQAIADKIQSLKGHSIRFMLYVDSNLTS